MVLIQYLLISVVFAVAWMVITVQINLWGFIIGYVLSFTLTVMVLRQRGVNFDPMRFPAQIFYLLWYIVVLAVDIFKSGVDVMLRVLGFRPIKPGIIQVNVQDDQEAIIALTAHGITITPGQLVVSCDENYVFVHCLDVDDSLPRLDSEQTNRVKHLKRIVGR